MIQMMTVIFMSKSESRKATKHLSFRVTPDEFEQLSAMAAVSKISVSSFCRRAAFSAAALPAPAYENRTPDKAAADFHKILGQIGRIASNLNQLTKLANSTKTVPVQKDLKILFAELRALREQILSGAKTHHNNSETYHGGAE